jgi:hypothetical protein
MNMKVIKLAAALAWAGAAVASAAPADAYALTTQVGGFATCSATYTGAYIEACWSCQSNGDDYDYSNCAPNFIAYYQQAIKMVSTACAQGACSSNTGVVYTTFLYGIGRKQASPAFYGCEYNVYGLDTCVC